MTPKTAEPKRAHRPVDDRIAELEAKIAGIKARETAKQAKKTPEGQVLVLAVRALDKADRVAEEAGNKDVAAAVESARAALAPAIVGLGIRIAEKPRRGGRRRKGEAA